MVGKPPNIIDISHLGKATHGRLGGGSRNIDQLPYCLHDELGKQLVHQAARLFRLLEARPDILTDEIHFAR